MAKLILTDEQQARLNVEFKTKRGHPASVDGVPEWTSSNPTIATVEASEDGMSAIVRAGTDLGEAQISVSADADLSGESKTITGVLDVEVHPASAVSAIVSNEAPEPLDEPTEEETGGGETGGGETPTT